MRDIERTFPIIKSVRVTLMELTKYDNDVTPNMFHGITSYYFNLNGSP
jgi:hypothetical protein